VDAGQGGEDLAVDPLIALVGANKHLEQIVRLTAHQIGFDDLCGFFQRGLERHHRGLPLVDQSDLDKYRGGMAAGAVG